MNQDENRVQPGERVVLFPSFGRYNRQDDAWRLHIRGAVFDPREVKLRQRVMLRLLRRLLSAEPHQYESEIFRSRIEAFTARTERGKRVAIRVGNQCFPLAKGSHRSGRFGGTIRLSGGEVEKLRADGQFQDDLLQVHVEGAEGEDFHGNATVHLMRDAGWSVVSDIDDTIKHSNVASRRELLANTFLREFRCVDGMSSVYQLLAEQGADFHYVSSSPWQLYVPLAQLIREAGFPYGTFHLRSFRLRDPVLRRVALHHAGKAVEIRHLVQSFPERKFILVGDSGERDPEIYAGLAKRFPEQIRAVFIRQLSEKPFSGERVKKLSGKLPVDAITTFDDPEPLANDCQRLIADSLTPSIL